MQPHSWDTVKGHFRSMVNGIAWIPTSITPFHIILIPYVVHCLHGCPVVHTHLRRSPGDCWGQRKEREGGKLETGKCKISSVCHEDQAPLPRNKNMK